MSNAFDIVLPILAVASLLLALYFFAVAVAARRGMSANNYDVEKQKKRQNSLVAFARSGFFLLLALIFFSVFGINALPEEVARPAVPTTVGTIVPEATEPIATISSPATPTSRSSTPTSPIPTRTPLPTDTPIPTDTPVVLTAIVASPNGLWLREAPGGTQQLELIPDGTTLLVLDSKAVFEEIEWQEVETEAGNTGWVAVDFIIYQ